MARHRIRVVLLLGLLLLGECVLMSRRVQHWPPCSLRRLMSEAEVVASATLVTEPGWLRPLAARYRIRRVVRGEVAPGDEIRVGGAGHLPYMDDSSPIPSAGEEVLLFLREGWWGWRPVAADGGVQTNARLKWSVRVAYLARIETSVLDALDELEAIGHLPPGLERDAREVDWILGLLEDPDTSGLAIKDLLANWRDCPDAPYRQDQDASDLRARMGAEDLTRLVDKLCTTGDTSNVCWSTAVLVSDEEDPCINEALVAQLTHALGPQGFPDSTAYFAGNALWVLAHRDGRPELMLLAEQYRSLPSLDDEKLLWLDMFLDQLAR